MLPVKHQDAGKAAETAESCSADKTRSCEEAVQHKEGGEGGGQRQNSEELLVNKLQ